MCYINVSQNDKNEHNDNKYIITSPAQNAFIFIWTQLPNKIFDFSNGGQRAQEGKKVPGESRMSQ